MSTRTTIAAATTTFLVLSWLPVAAEPLNSSGSGVRTDVQAPEVSVYAASQGGVRVAPVIQPGATATSGSGPQSYVLTPAEVPGLDAAAYQTRPTTGQAPAVQQRREIAATTPPQRAPQAPQVQQYNGPYEMPYDVVGDISWWRAPEYRMNFAPGRRLSPAQVRQQQQNDAAAQEFFGSMIGAVAQGALSGALRGGGGGGGGGACPPPPNVCWWRLNGH